MRVPARAGAVALAALAAAAGAAFSRGEDPVAAATPVTASVDELTPQGRDALEGGLAYLAKEQGADGSSGGSSNNQSVRLATTSLAGLAFLSAGSTPERGPYRDSVRGALRFVLSRADHAHAPYVSFHDPASPEQPGRMHAHGFALLFLAESYGMLGGNEDLAKEVRSAIVGAVKTTLASQTPKGGWGYSFAGESSFAYGVDEASTTITQIQGLRAARNAGVTVSSKAISRAVDYVKTCVDSNGECRYSLTMEKGEKTSFELSAAAVSTLNASGAYGAEKLDLALAYMRREIAKTPEHPTHACLKGYYFYGNLYAAQAMFQAGGADWASWFKGAQQDLVEQSIAKDRERRWEDPRSFGDAYATASACLILAIPLRYLPILER